MDTGGNPHRSVPEREIASTSAELPPARWTEELAADFMAGLEPAARRMALHVWRAGAKGIHRSALCQRTELRPAELRSLLMRMGHALRRFQRERGMAANSPLQTYFLIPTSPQRRRPRRSTRGRRTNWPKPESTEGMGRAGLTRDFGWFWKCRR